jgi:hypothetical protein
MQGGAAVKRFLPRWQRRLCVVLLSLIGVTVQGAAAKPNVRSSQNTEQAKQEALTALSVGNPGHAEEILDRTFRTDPDPHLLYQLGLVAQAQGRYVAALDLYRRYQELVGSAASAENTAAIETFAASMSAPFTTLNVSASGGLLLSVDDKIVGILPLPSPMLIAGGTHRFRIERKNELYETGTLAVPDGREADLRLSPGANGKAVAVLSLAPIALFVVQPKNLPSAVLQSVQKALAAAARQKHLAPLPQSRLALLLGKRGASCLEEADCQFSIAEQAQARVVLRAMVLTKEEAAEDATPTSAPASCLVQLEYLDVNAGQVAAQGATEKTECSGLPLAGALAGVVERLLAQTNSRLRGMVSVSSVPEGADVRVDGLLRGTTPYLRASFVGPHEISVERNNFHPWKAQVEVAQGQVAAAQAPLRAMPEAEREPEPAPLAVARRVPKLVFVDHQNPRPRWRLGLGGAGLGVGILLSGFGIAALSVNGQCTQEPKNGGVCDANFATGALGGGLLGAGLVLSVAGSVLIGLPGSRERLSGTIYVDP